MRRLPKRPLLLLALVPVALGACGDDDGTNASAPPTAGPPTTTVEELVPFPNAFVGEIEESDLFIAVVPGDDGTVQAYTCDGTDTVGTVDQWFTGDWDGQSPVTLAGGEFELTLQREADAITGNLTLPAGEALPFRATLAGEGEGFHVLEKHDRATGEVVDRDGLIVVDGDRRGAMAPLQTQCRYITKRRYDVVTGQMYEYVVRVCF